MTPMMLTALLLGQVCFTPSDARPGWKRALIPDDAPRLAAPDGIDQYRSAEAYQTVNEYPMASLQGWTGRVGKTEFQLIPGAGACELELEFAEPLRGAKVSITAPGPKGPMVFMREARQAGKVLRAKWGKDGVPLVDVVVHDHFRKDPVLQRWKAVCIAPVVLTETTAERWLTYLQPAGLPLTLCERPGATMQVHGDPGTMNVNAASVALTRQ